MVIIGIDPGKTGGLAALAEDGTIVRVVGMPETCAGILDFFRDLRVGEGDVKAYLEHVHTMPDDAARGGFTFGKGVGHLEMALCAALVPFDKVLPRVWQGKLQCLSKGDKNVTKRRALELFPRVKVTHAIADALLIAEYGRRRERPNAW